MKNIWKLVFAVVLSLNAVAGFAAEGDKEERETVATESSTGCGCETAAVEADVNVDGGSSSEE